MSKEKLEKIMEKKERLEREAILKNYGVILPDHKRINLAILFMASIALLCGAIVAILMHFNILGGVNG